MYPSPPRTAGGKRTSLIPNGSFETCPIWGLPHSGQRGRGRVYHRIVNTVPANTKPMIKPMIKYEIISHPAAEELHQMTVRKVIVGPLRFSSDENYITTQVWVLLVSSMVCILEMSS